MNELIELLELASTVCYSSFGASTHDPFSRRVAVVSGHLSGMDSRDSDIARGPALGAIYAPSIKSMDPARSPYRNLPP